MSHDKSHSEKFKEAARELGADEDEKRCEERPRKVAKQRLSQTLTSGVYRRRAVVYVSCHAAA